MKKYAFPNIYTLNGPILVTGHTGFKGSWMSMLLDSLSIAHIGLSLLPDKNSLYLQVGLGGQRDETFLDIRDREAVNKFVLDHQPSAVIHLAAQSLVLESYKSPLETFSTNVMGTANLLNAAISTKSCKSFIGVTTDKVYKNENLGRRFIETDPLEGKDPYSASKVGTESVLSAWRQIASFGSETEVISVRAGNVIGGGDLASNRIIPDLVRAISKGQRAEIRNPESTRPWQHVLDPLFGYLLTLEYSLSSVNPTKPAFNFGPSDPSLPVKKVVEGFREVFPEILRTHSLEENNQEKESINLDLDSSLAHSHLNWQPIWSQEEAIKLTATWWDTVLFKGITAKEASQRDILEFLKNLELN